VLSRCVISFSSRPCAMIDNNDFTNRSRADESIVEWHQICLTSIFKKSEDIIYLDMWPSGHGSGLLNPEEKKTLKLQQLLQTPENNPLCMYSSCRKFFHLSICSAVVTLGEFRFDRTIRSEKYRISDARDPMSDEHHPNFGTNLSHLGRYRV
jgi:hypothetical protein